MFNQLKKPTGQESALSDVLTVGDTGGTGSEFTVDEPGTGGLVALALAGLVLRRRRAHGA